MPVAEVPLIAQCVRVLDQSPWGALDLAAARRTLASVDPASLSIPEWSGGPMFDGSDAQVVAWLLAYNAINFCYWPEPGQPRWYAQVDGVDVGGDDEALGVMGAFAEALRRGAPLDDGAFLVGLNADELAALLCTAPGAGALPLMAERLAGLRELGRAYLEAGGPLGLIGAPGASAPAVAARLAGRLPMWADQRAWRGEVVPFRKRAQLCVAMIRGRFAGKGPGAFRDVARLTAFADYRLPQVLRALGVLELDRGLALRIDQREEIALGSEEEVTLRAAAVVGAEVLRAGWAEANPDLTALEVDYWLWRTAVDRDADLPPFHRTRCVDY